MSDEPVTIATTFYPAEAHVLRTRLEWAGIPCFIVDEYIVTTNWLLCNAVGGVKLQVKASDAQSAMEIIYQDSRKTHRESYKRNLTHWIVVISMILYLFIGGPVY